MRVGACGITGRTAGEISRDAPCHTIAVKGDVAKAKDVRRLFDETKKIFSTLDVLVNRCFASPQRLGVARHIAVIASTSNVPEPTITPAKSNI